MFAIIGWIIFGAIVGFIAKAIHPGDEKLDFVRTVLLGVAGSFVGGSVSYVLGWNNYLLGSSGLLMSIVGAVIVCFLWAKFGKHLNGQP